MTDTRIPVSTCCAPDGTASRPAAAANGGRIVLPPVDVVETADAFTLRFDLPGARREDISLHLEEDLLTLEAPVRLDAPGQALYAEFDIARYHREFRLGEAIDRDAIRADLRHGVLTLTLPRRRQRVVIPVTLEAGEGTPRPAEPLG